MSLLDDVSKQRGVHQFQNIAQVDVGIVTGANKFFLVPDAVVHEYELHRWAHPMFGRSEHCPGVIYDERQHRENAADGTPTNFLWFDNLSHRLPTRAREYIDEGEHQKLHTRYKCRIRKPWYVVPSVYSTDVGLLKRSHDTPKLILNKMGAYTTDTAYRIKSKGGRADRLVYCFLNPLTALSAELEGRFYGGGVLELVPSEIEKLVIPIPTAIQVDLRRLDQDVRHISITEILLHQGALVLGSLGISDRDTAMLLGAWDRLRNRRQRIRSDA
jgi:adenine-specific DNA methylase